MLETPGGTPPPEQNPEGTNPEDSKPKTKMLKISDSTAYEVPENFELPENILKGLQEKDKTISSFKNKINELETEVRLNKEWSERVSNSLSVKEVEDIPDPVEDPKGYREYLDASVEKRVAETVKKKNALLSNTNWGLQKLHNLTGGDVQKVERVINHLKEKDYGIIKDGDTYHINPNVIEDAYNAVFHDEILQSEIQKVREEMKKEIEEMQKSTVSVGGVPVYDNQGKPLHKMTVEERHELLKSEDEPFGVGKRPKK